MSLFAIWPMVAAIGAVMLILSVRTPFRFLDSAPVAHAHRANAIDGLRGILATGVAFSHVMMLGWGIRTGQAGLPPSHFYLVLGGIGVSIFFMITGYLFWGKLVDSNGKIQWKQLYIGRFFRIYPMYLFTILCYFAFCLIEWDGPRSTNPAEIASQAFQWLTVRLIASEPTPFLGITPFYGMMGQTWTLRYEWMFYLSLPLLAILARERSHLTISATVLCLFVVASEHLPAPYGYFAMQFAAGAVVASLLRTYPALKSASILHTALAAVALLVAFRVDGDAYSLAATLSLAVFFLFIAGGVSFGGLLTSRGAVRLGNMSYGIYLMHGLIINTILANRWILGFLKLRTPEWYWVVADGIYLAEVVVCACTYFFVERSGVALGKAVMMRLSATPGADKAVSGLSAGRKA